MHASWANLLLGDKWPCPQNFLREEHNLNWHIYGLEFESETAGLAGAGLAPIVRMVSASHKA